MRKTYWVRIALIVCTVSIIGYIYKNKSQTSMYEEFIRDYSIEEMQSFHLLRQNVGVTMVCCIARSTVDGNNTAFLYEPNNVDEGLRYKFAFSTENRQVVPQRMSLLGIADITNDDNPEIFLASLHDGSAMGYDVAILSYDYKSETFVLSGTLPETDEQETIINFYDETQKSACGGSTYRNSNYVLHINNEIYLACASPIFGGESNAEAHYYELSIYKPIMNQSEFKISWNNRMASCETVRKEKLCSERLLIDTLLQNKFLTPEEAENFSVRELR